MSDLNLLSETEVLEISSRALVDIAPGTSILLIVPDNTRTAPVGLMFRTIYDLVGSRAQRFDVLIALGTHPPLSDEAVNRRLEITREERGTTYASVRVYNHTWGDPNSLRRLGSIRADEVSEITDGLFTIDVDVEINKRVLDYDRVIIVGPVFPHEVVGYSGGNKYLFPGVSGPEILNFFHWLGAVITNPKIIGHKHTPVRRVIDRAAAMLPIPCLAFCLVVSHAGLHGVFAGQPKEAWSAAADLSSRVHVMTKPVAFHTVLSSAPRMYDEIWVAGKCMYKLEGVVADGGELIIYGPHIDEISVTHGERIRRIGYHTRDYFLAQWDRFKDEPWGILAHSTHVRGIGAYEGGVELPRINVTLATKIPEAVCKSINLGYRDPASIDVEDYTGREDQGVLCVPSAGEVLYRLTNPPEWAR